MAFLELGNVTLLTSNETHARELDGFSGKGGVMGGKCFARMRSCAGFWRSGWRRAARAGAGGWMWWQ